MIDSNLTEPPNPPLYPLLAKLPGAEYVVLFAGPRDGTVVVSGDKFPVGHYSDCWISGFEAIPKGSQVVLEQR